MLRFGLKIILLGAVLVAPLAPAVAEELYTFDLAKRYPAAMKAYQRLIPKSFRKEAWIYKLDGVGNPIEQKTVDGVDFLAGTSCKPHDCGDNSVALLVTKDGSRAVAEIELADSNSEFFGDPSDAEQAVLDEMLQ